MWKRLAILISFAGLLFFAFPFPALAADFSLEAKGAILMDAATGQVLFEQNADEKWYPASMTKIMTLGLALEAIHQEKAQLADQVLTSENAAGYGGSQVYLAPGEIFTLEEMLIAISVGSANDASVAVAEHLAGSEENFVRLMNEKAQQLGAVNTHFTNSHGLHDDEHYTTPRDMALISQWALKLPKMKELTTIKEYTFRGEPRPLILYNTNKLLWWYPGVTGLKTGTTSAAKRNLAASVEKDGLELIGVVMGVDRKNGHFAETMKLFNWGFANFIYEKIFDQHQTVEEVKVSKGQKDRLAVITAEAAGALLAKSEEKELDTLIELPHYLPAPINRGEKVGSLIIRNKGQEIRRIDLLAGENIARVSFWGMFTKSWNRVVTLGQQ